MKFISPQNTHYIFLQSLLKWLYWKH